MNKEEREAKLREVLASPATSDWFKGAVLALSRRDPLDAARDVQGLVTLFGFDTLKARGL